MNIRPEEISVVIKEQIKNYKKDLSVSDYGTVLQVGDGIARVYGMDKCMEGELLDFGNDIFGMAQNLEEDNVGVVILGSDREIKEGDIVKPTGRVVEVPCGEALIGRVVNALGEPIDGKGTIHSNVSRPIEFSAPGVLERRSVYEPLQTGIKAIDAMIPIGKGQRELIIGVPAATLPTTGMSTTAFPGCSITLPYASPGVVCPDSLVGSTTISALGFDGSFTRNPSLARVSISL